MIEGRLPKDQLEWKAHGEVWAHLGMGELSYGGHYAGALFYHKTRYLVGNVGVCTIANVAHGQVMHTLYDTARLTHGQAMLTTYTTTNVANWQVTWACVRP